MTAQPTPKNIAYLVKIFPKVSETFILQEILDLEALGLDLTIYALQRPTNAMVHGLASHVHASVTYLPETPLSVHHNPLLAHLRLFLSSPWRYLSTLRFWLQTPERPSFSKFLQAGSLARAMQDAQIDHLHAHFANAPTSIAELVYRLIGIPYSMTCHAKDLFLTTPSSLRRKIRHAAFVVTCTEHNRSYLQDLSEHGTPLHRLYHGLNLDRFDHLRASHSGLPTTSATIMSVGRFREKKGFLTLIRACHVLTKRGHRFHCCIVGYGPLQPQMEALIRELNLQDIIALVGKRPLEEVVGLYQAADIFALPCQVAQDGDRDGIPNVLMEAMACHLPVVTTAVSGIPELVRHDHNGILVPPEDPETLALVLGHLLENPALRQRLGKAGRETIVQQFSSLHTSSRLKALLLEETSSDDSRLSNGETSEARGREHDNAESRASDSAATPSIGYVVKGFPRRSEAFITNEIALLEQMGLRLHLFSAFQGETDARRAQAYTLRSTLTYLPEDHENTDSGFAFWLIANLPRYLPSHLQLFRTTPGRYLRTVGETITLSWRCRTGFFALPKKVFYKDFLRAGFIAAAIVETNTIRHLHAHFCHGATTMAMFAGMLTELPFSFTAHAKDIYLPKLNPGDLLRIKLSRAKFVVTCTEANQQHLEAICPQGAPIHAIYHGVNLARFSPMPHRQPSATPTILSVGRFVEKKGFPYLIEACRILKGQGVAFHCRIVGEPDEQTDLVQNLIREYELEKDISIEPGVSQEELRVIYQSASVFVLPCRIVDNGDRDGIPNVLAEAMASGLPVISTTVSGIPELIEHRRTGLLVAQRDAAALADAIGELLRDSRLRNGLAEAGRATIHRIFDSTATTRQLFDLFQTEVFGSSTPHQEAYVSCS